MGLDPTVATGHQRTVNVVQIITKPQRRGAEIFAHELSTWLETVGHRTQVVSLYEHMVGPRLTMRPHDVELGGRENARRERVLDPLLLVRLVQLLRAERPDVVQANGGRAVKYVAAARQLVGDAPLWVYRNIDQPSFWVRSRLARAVLPRIVRAGFDAAVAVSRTTLVDVRQMYGFENSSIAIENGVDFEKLHSTTSQAQWREQHGVPATAPLLVFAGALNAQKRPDVTVDVFARLQDRTAQLVMLGEGPWRERVVAAAAAHGCRDRVHLLGNVDDVGAAFGAGDIFVTTSDTEGIPAVVIEAQHCGLPVLGFDVGGMRECVVDGETGTLVAHGDVDALVTALDRVLKDPTIRGRQGAAAKVFSARFDIATVGQRYLDFYREQTAAKPAKGHKKP